VWTGHQARELGLVDELGGLDLAIRRAAERAKLDPAKGVSLVVYPAKRSIYDLLSRQFGSSTDASAGLEAIFHRPEIRAVQTAVSALQLFRRGEPLAILPSVFTR
jgi:protease-4